tara:strand:- start:566 stop:739 length:174 start_codon:yes stop_codon:yes gene_type:complete
MAKKWVKKAVEKMKEKGEQLDAKEGKSIPKGKLAEAAKKCGKLGKRAQFALNVNKKS